jgi:mannose-6-phosphate isomerase-like protein (cupin superfamily)
MANLEAKSFDQPDETRRFENHGKMDVVQIEDGFVGKAVFEPGWQWSKDVKPIVKTESCQVHHLGYVLSGRMNVRMNDGTERELGPGEVFQVPPGHDAWVLGNEPCITLEFGAASHFAKR